MLTVNYKEVKGTCERRIVFSAILVMHIDKQQERKSYLIDAILTRSTQLCALRMEVPINILNLKSLNFKHTMIFGLNPLSH